MIDIHLFTNCIELLEEELSGVFDGLILQFTFVEWHLLGHKEHVALQLGHELLDVVSFGVPAGQVEAHDHEAVVQLLVVGDLLDDVGILGVAQFEVELDVVLGDARVAEVHRVRLQQAVRGEQPLEVRQSEHAPARQPVQADELLDDLVRHELRGCHA
jgi:hypothetical protein